MNPEEQPGSLADQAASWVPPWQRPVVPAVPEAVDAPDDEPDDEVALDADGAIDEGLAELIGDRTAEDTPAVEADDEIESFRAAVDEEDDQDIEVDDIDDAAGDEIDAAGDEARDVDAAGGELADSVLADVAMAQAADVGDAAADAPDEPFDLKGALEAILLVVDEPVTEEALAQVLHVPVAMVAAQLTATSAEYTASGRGFDLRRVAGGWRLYTRGEFAAYVERFVLDGQSVRLTQAALETLAVIAYQQPVTRSRISAIRGVNCDGTVRTLVTRGLVEECGTQPESGAFLYRTTSVFLEKLGLDSVDELPPLAPFLPDDVNGFADAQR